MWYRYVPAADGTMIVSVCTPPISTGVSIHNRCPGDQVSELTCSVFGGFPECLDDREGTERLWETTLNVTAGTEYLIRVASACSGCELFPFILNLTGPDCLVSPADPIDCNRNGVHDACDP